MLIGVMLPELSETFISTAPQPKVSHVSKSQQPTAHRVRQEDFQPFLITLSATEAYAKLKGTILAVCCFHRPSAAHIISSHRMDDITQVP